MSSHWIDKLVSLIDNDTDVVSDAFQSEIERAKSAKQSLRGALVHNLTLLSHLANQRLKNHLAFVLNSGIDFNVNEDNLNEWQCKPLHYALDRQSEDCLSLLLAAGADPNLVDERGRTALHYACSYNTSTASIDLLLAYGASVHARSIFGQQPLHVARTAAAMRKLVEAGANVNEHVYNGKNALFAFTPPIDTELGEILEVYRVLLDAGIDRSMTQKDGPAPILRKAFFVGALHNGCDFNEDTRRAMHVFALLLSYGLPLNTSFDDSAVPFGDARNDELRVGLVSGTDFCPVRVGECEIGWSDNTMTALRSMYVHAPHRIEWGQNDDLKQVCEDEKVEQEKTKLMAIKEQYQRILWQYCSKRVIDLAMIFVELPALIIVEIWLRNLAWHLRCFRG